MHAGRRYMHTCVQPVVLGLCPKMKNHPLCGWMVIILRYIYCAFPKTAVLRFSRP